MWASAALLTALTLAPEQVHQLKVVNERVCHGPLGWERKDARNPKLLPGDLYVLVFDIDGLTMTPEGRVKYSMAVQVSDSSGKVVFPTPAKDPEEFEDVAGLGGRRVGANAQMALGTETRPGNYTIKVTVVDKAAKNASTTLTRTFQVMPTELGFTRLLISFPPLQMPTPAPPLAVPGQIYLVNFAPVGFKLDAKTMQPKFELEMRVLDETGSPVLREPFKGNVSEVPEKWKKILPMQFVLALNRTGKFRIVLKVIDKVANKTAEQSLDFQVVEPR